jgi:hypothetical protein
VGRGVRMKLVKLGAVRTECRFEGIMQITGPFGEMRGNSPLLAVKERSRYFLS